jgi:hypothetical protein
MSIVMSTDLQDLTSLLVRLEKDNKQATTLQGRLAGDRQATTIKGFSNDNNTPRIKDSDRESLATLTSMLSYCHDKVTIVRPKLKGYIKMVLDELNNPHQYKKSKWLWECEEKAYAVLTVMTTDLWQHSKKDNDKFQSFDWNGRQVDIKDVMWDIADECNRLQKGP